MDTYIKKIGNLWYAFGSYRDTYQVISIGGDCPKEGGLWVAQGFTDEAIKYVASGSPTRSAAYQKARRYGNYCGEV